MEMLFCFETGAMLRSKALQIVQHLIFVDKVEYCLKQGKANFLL